MSTTVDIEIESEQPLSERKSVHRFSQVVRRQVGIDHRSLYVSVTHQLHHGRQVDTLHNQVAGKRMTKCVNPR